MKGMLEELSLLMDPGLNITDDSNYTDVPLSSTSNQILSYACDDSTMHAYCAEETKKVVDLSDWETYDWKENAHQNAKACAKESMEVPQEIEIGKVFNLR